MFGIEIVRIGGKRGACRMFDALIHRQNREIAGSRQAAGVVQRLHIAQHSRRTVIVDHHAIDIIRTGQIEVFCGKRQTAMLKKRIRVLAQ